MLLEGLQDVLEAQAGFQGAVDGICLELQRAGGAQTFPQGETAETAYERRRQALAIDDDLQVRLNEQRLRIGRRDRRRLGKPQDPPPERGQANQPCALGIPGRLEQAQGKGKPQQEGGQPTFLMRWPQVLLRPEGVLLEDPRLDVVGTSPGVRRQLCQQQQAEQAGRRIGIADRLPSRPTSLRIPSLQEQQGRLKGRHSRRQPFLPDRG